MLDTIVRGLFEVDMLTVSGMNNSCGSFFNVYLILFIECIHVSVFLLRLCLFLVARLICMSVYHFIVSFMQISQNLYEQHVKGASLFKECSEGFIKQIVSHDVIYLK